MSGSCTVSDLERYDSCENQVSQAVTQRLSRIRHTCRAVASYFHRGVRHRVAPVSANLGDRGSRYQQGERRFTEAR